MSVLVEPNEVIDCSNPKLFLFTTLNELLTNVAEAEFAIFDIVDPMFPVQTFPVAGFQAINVTDLCPTGQRISTGKYTALWTVAAAEPLTSHKITWRFRLNLGDPQQEEETPFNVVSVAGSTDPINVALFRGRFPDFSDPIQFPAALLLEVLNEAQFVLDPTCFGPLLYDVAVRYLAAHLLTFTTGGARARGANAVSAGSASVSWDTSRTNWGATAYGQKVLSLARLCTGATIVCDD